MIDVDKPGLYRFDDGTLRTVAAVGNPDPLEFSDVRATDAKLKPLVEASGGAHDVAGRQPRSRHPLGAPRPAAGGSDWIGLRRNEGYTVAGINQPPLLPGILVALAFLMAIGSAWWREGRSSPYSRQLSEIEQRFHASRGRRFDPSRGPRPHLDH